MTVSLRVTTTVTLCIRRKVYDSKFELTLGLTQTVVRRFRHKKTFYIRILIMQLLYSIL